MKLLPLVLLISFGAAAQSPSTNFNSSSDNATVVNTTNTESLQTDESDYVGKTEFKVLFHAIGCAGVDTKQTDICNSQIVQSGQSASYHFKWGTLKRGAQICLPRGHHGDDDWNCGTLNGIFDGHLSFSLSNGQQAEVSKLYFYKHQNETSVTYAVRGNVAKHK